MAGWDSDRARRIGEGQGDLVALINNHVADPQKAKEANTVAEEIDSN
jgi:hypothetical protein